MSELVQVNCPACSQAMRFQAGATGQVALTCPKCAHLFQVRLGGKNQPAQPVVAKPVVAKAVVAKVVAKAVVAKPVITSSVIAKPVQAPSANDPFDDVLASAEFSRPILPARPILQKKPKSAPSPVVMIVLPLVLVGVLVIGIGGYFAFSWIGSFKAADQSRLAAGDTGGGELLSSSSATAQGSTDDTQQISSWGASSLANDSSSSVTSTRSTGGSPNEHALDSETHMSNTSMHVASPSSSTSSGGSSSDSSSSATGGQVAASNGRSAQSDSMSSTSLADVIEKAEKSVVRIEVTSADGDSLGSGFVVDNMGTLVTNCHVLAGATSAVAFFPDGRRAPILGTKLIEEAKDIAIAHIADTSAPPIALAVALPRKGERVTALGAPHGLAFTATTGIVSAIRPGSEIDSTHKGTWIQVDAAISPGNSGGPLINASGEVVGMSTLASQGTAQNLNFGISGIDITEALSRARNTATISLAAGAGKVKMRESSSGSSEDSPIREAKISDEVFAQYVASGISEFDELLKSMRLETTQMSMDLKEMKKGENRMPPGLQSEDTPFARIAVRGQRAPKWFFQSESVKQAVVQQQIERIKVLTKLKSEIREKSDPESLYALLWNHGPALSVRRNETIGYADELIVLHAFNEHDALVLLEETPYLLWAPSTAGMSAGEIIEGPVYVAGTATARMRGGVSTAVTVLQLVSEEQLRTAVEKATESPDGFRTWKDKSGDFSIVAKLLGHDATKVILQKQDGTIVNVPIDKLSAEDLLKLSLAGP